MKPSRIWMMVAALAALAALGTAQQKSTDSSKDKDAKGKQSTSQTKQKSGISLFGKSLANYNSSSSSKESTTLAFKGLDPSGKVDKAMLAKVPSSDDQAKVTEMAANMPSSDELKAFLKEGGLKRK